MLGVFKGFVVALALLAATAEQANAITVSPPPVLPLPNSEAWALFQWPQLAKRDGDHLLVMNHGGGKYSDKAAVLTDGAGACQTYRFNGVLKLFDAYTRRIEPVADVICTTPDGQTHMLIGNPDWPPSVTSLGKLTASADGHYVFADSVPIYRAGPDGKRINLGSEAHIYNWTGVFTGSQGLVVSCRQARPDAAEGFRATCRDAATGQDFNARFALDPAKPGGGQTAWRLFNLSDPSDTGAYLFSGSSEDVVIMLDAGPDPFDQAKAETKALADHPGLLRRDGPALVVLDHGRDVWRIHDSDHCMYWFKGQTVDLYDPRAGAKAPAAVIQCPHGNSQNAILAAAYDPAPFPWQRDNAVSDDGRTALIRARNADNVLATTVVDWPSRKPLASYASYCYNLKAQGNDRFSATCEAVGKANADSNFTVDFVRNAQGVWAATARPVKAN